MSTDRPSELIVDQQYSLRETMEAINVAASGIAFVVDVDETLIGTVTDGDIRRALLEGKDLNDKITTIMNQDPLVKRTDESLDEFYDRISPNDEQKAEPHGSLTVPVVNEDGKIVDVTYYQKNLPLFEINWRMEDINNAIDSIGRGSYWAKGPYVDEFESGIERYIGIEHAITVNSGTTALVTALKACGIGPGDEVIVPSFSFIATANSVRLAGAEPVFADIETDTYGLSPDSVKRCINQSTSAIIPVHVFGEPCKIGELSDIASDNSLYLIEDAAAAMGAKYHDKFIGTIGDVGIFSFAQNKIITTGEGGAIVTSDDEIAKKARLYRSHGRASEGYFDSPGTGEYVSLGSNYRLADVNAAIGSAQLNRIDELIEKRREKAEMLTSRLRDISALTPPNPSDKCRHVYQLYTLTLDEGIDRDGFLDELTKEGVSSKIYWDPIHQTQYYQDESVASRSPLDVTEDVSSRVLSLSFHPDLTESDINFISDTVHSVVDKGV